MNSSHSFHIRSCSFQFHLLSQFSMLFKHKIKCNPEYAVVPLLCDLPLFPIHIQGTEIPVIILIINIIVLVFYYFWSSCLGSALFSVSTTVSPSSLEPLTLSHSPGSQFIALSLGTEILTNYCVK